MLDPRKTLINSNYQTDQIIAAWRKTITIVPDANNYCEAKFAHGLPFIPLLGGFWSRDSGLSNAHPFDVETTVAFGTAETLDLSADGTNIYLVQTGGGGQAATGGTFFVTIYALIPNGYSSKLRSIDLNQFKPRVVNSRYNYMKLVRSGELAGGSGEKMVNHRLGYMPSVRLWYRDSVSGRVHVLNSYAYGLELTPQYLRFSGNTPALLYRIYADEA